MNNSLSPLTNDEYTALAEEIQACFTEKVHAAREEILQAHHYSGKVMFEFLQEHPEVKPLTLITRLEQQGAQKQTTLYLALQCYERWPHYEAMIDEVGQGKNTSWNKVRQTLQAPKDLEKKELPECNHECLRHCKS